MAINPNELVIDRVRSLSFSDLTDGTVLLRLTSIEDPSLETTSTGEEVVDAIGALITTLYRAKRGKFSGSNSLFSLDLTAAQFGSTKQVASAGSAITVPADEILTISDTTATLSHVPVGTASAEVKYIYALNTDGSIGKKYAVAATASATEFSIVAATKTITVPTGLTGNIYVEYNYSSESAVKVANNTDGFPVDGKLVANVIFRNKCNSNIVYAGKIIAAKAKLNPESINLALKSDGKHPFEFTMLKDACDEKAELFSIIVAED